MAYDKFAAVDSSTLLFPPTVRANLAGVSPNYIINGGFDIWQRGTSLTSTANVYVSDRWYGEGGNVTVSRQTTGVPPASTYCMRTAMTSTTFNNKYQIIESLNASALHGKTVTFQVKLRRNASLTGGLVVRLSKSATVDAGMGATWVEIVGVAVSNASLPTGTGASDWYTATITGLIPNDGTANTVRVEVSQAVVEPSGAYWEMAEAQLEVGSVATPFRRNANSIQGELAACQRYYYRAVSDNTYGFLGMGMYINSTQAIIYINFPVVMRSTISATLDWTGNTSQYQLFAVSGSTVSGSPSILSDGMSTRAAPVSFTTAGATAGQAVGVRANNSSTVFLGFSAEL